MYILKEERAETVHACTKTRNCGPPWLLAAAPKIRQHLIFSSSGLELLIYHFKKLICPRDRGAEQTGWARAHPLLATNGFIFVCKILKIIALSRLEEKLKLEPLKTNSE